MTETEEEAEVAVERISLAVSSSLVSMVMVVMVVMVVRMVCMRDSGHWTILVTTHYHHMFTY